MTIDERDVISELFAERVSNPLQWFKHSRALLAAARSTRERAEVLIDYAEKSELDNVATMLYGFSLENLFKAILTLNKFGSPYNEDWRPEATFPDQLKTHDLTQLLELIDVDMAERYAKSLSMLSETVIWAGRYPCSIKGDEGTIMRWSNKVHDDAEAMFKKCSRPFTTIS